MPENSNTTTPQVKANLDLWRKTSKTLAIAKRVDSKQYKQDFEGKVDKKVFWSRGANYWRPTSVTKS